MRIHIEYNSSWAGEIKKDSPFGSTSITKETVIGVLFRLVGDVRPMKLKKGMSAKKIILNEDKDWLGVKFDGIEFKDNMFDSNASLTALRGESKATASKCIKHLIVDLDKDEYYADRNPFLADFIRILKSSDQELCVYIERGVLPDIDVKDLTVEDYYQLCEEIRKPSNKEDKFDVESSELRRFKGILPDKTPDKDGGVKEKGIKRSDYVAFVLYRYFEANKSNCPTVLLSKNGNGILGVSQQGSFTLKDIGEPFYFLPNAVYSKPKKIAINSGKLIIDIDVSLDRAKEIRAIIENAGVMSFYLGKKGLAYVKRIELHNYLRKES